MNAPVTAAAVEAEAAVEHAEAAGEARPEATAEAGATGKAGPEAKSGKVAKQRVEPERTKAAEEALRKLLFAPKLTDLEMMRGAISEGEIAEVQPELLAEATGMHPLLSASSLHPLSTSPPLHRSTAPPLHRSIFVLRLRTPFLCQAPLRSAPFCTPISAHHDPSPRR